MKRKPKTRTIIIWAIVLCLLGYVAYLCFHFFFYRKYEACLVEYPYEDGIGFTALPDSGITVDGMVLAAENDILKLYTNTKTTEIAVLDKRNGEITRSNPIDRMDDPIAAGRNKVALNSQLHVTYYDSTMTAGSLYNYDYSVEKEQFEIEKIENGIRYIYLLGDLSSPTGLVPPIITAERLEEKVYSKLSERDAKSIRSNYLESQDNPGFMELSTGSRASKVGLQKMNKLFEQAGYTMEDFDYDASMAAGGEIQARTTFTIPLEYRLVGDRLEVTIPSGEIVEAGTGRIYSISMLPFFGAGGVEDEGYMMVPNGSGSLIYFNNGKKTERYIQYIYGIEETAQSYTIIEEMEKARMPVFGIKNGERAFLCEITSGDALADLSAMVSGNLNSYNYVYPSFNLRGKDVLSMFGVEGMSADLPLLEKEMYALDLEVSYAFLDKNNADYSGMADYYRNKLISEGSLAKKEEAASIPFYLNIVGGVKRQESFLGIPYMGEYPMTRFDEAEKIVDAFLKQDIPDIRLNYLGWFNGGYYHDAAKNITVDRVLGGRRGLSKLNQILTASGGRLFGDVAFQKVSFESDHYNWRMETAQYYSGFVVAMGRTNPATVRTSSMTYHEVMYDVLSPKFLVRYVDNFLKDFEKLDMNGLALRDMGDMLAPDKRRSNVINRQEAKQIMLGQLEKLDRKSDWLMINGGNAYSWAYSSDLCCIPAGHNPFYIVDEEIPFYQMVIHGCIDYTGSAINLSDSYDKRELILRILEFGMAPHFTLSWEDSSEIKYTGLNIFYTTLYKIWLDEAADIYHQVNDVLKHVTASTVSEHQILEAGVKRVRYDNGCVIYINTTDKDAEYDGITIPAKGYALEGVRK